MINEELRREWGREYNEMSIKSQGSIASYSAFMKRREEDLKKKNEENINGYFVYFPINIGRVINENPVLREEIAKVLAIAYRNGFLSGQHEGSAVKKQSRHPSGI